MPPRGGTKRKLPNQGKEGTKHPKHDKEGKKHPKHGKQQAMLPKQDKFWAHGAELGFENKPTKRQLQCISKLVRCLARLSQRNLVIEYKVVEQGLHAASVAFSDLQTNILPVRSAISQEDALLNANYKLLRLLCSTHGLLSANVLLQAVAYAKNMVQVAALMVPAFDAFIPCFRALNSKAAKWKTESLHALFKIARKNTEKAILQYIERSTGSSHITDICLETEGEIKKAEIIVVNLRRRASEAVEVDKAPEEDKRIIAKPKVKVFASSSSSSSSDDDDDIQVISPPLKPKVEVRLSDSSESDKETEIKNVVQKKKEKEKATGERRGDEKQTEKQVKTEKTEEGIEEGLPIKKRKQHEKEEASDSPRKRSGEHNIKTEPMSPSSEGKKSTKKVVARPRSDESSADDEDSSMSKTHTPKKKKKKANDSPSSSPSKSENGPSVMKNTTERMSPAERATTSERTAPTPPHGTMIVGRIARTPFDDESRWRFVRSHGVVSVWWREEKAAEWEKEHTEEMEQFSALIHDHFLNNVQGKTEYDRKLQVLNLLTNAAKSVLEEFGVSFRIVGSTCSFLSAFNSDLNLCLMHPTDELDCTLSRRIFPKLANALMLVPELTLTAKLPLNLEYSALLPGSETPIVVKISFFHVARFGQLMTLYEKVDDRLAPLCLFLKHWTLQKDFKIDRFRSINSYLMTSLLIHFLQCGVSPPVLPCLHELYPDELAKDKILELDPMTPFDPPLPARENDQSLSSLLLGFFDYFSTFRFDEFYISIRTGRPIRLFNSNLSLPPFPCEVVIADPSDHSIPITPVVGVNYLQTAMGEAAKEIRSTFNISIVHIS